MTTERRFARCGQAAMCEVGNRFSCFTHLATMTHLDLTAEQRERERLERVLGSLNPVEGSN